MEEPEPHPILDGELQWAVAGVVVSLGVGLSLEQPVANVGKEGIPVLKKGVHRGRAR
jgi:hypothetical protein